MCIRRDFPVYKVPIAEDADHPADWGFRFS